ncbi:uncharacterized protein [Diadema antillarum]|uniref:uncharacterized protein n=1 Tax=Diadema antillarum TaxID=105358 RepID=UPI003A8C4618
MLKWAHQGGKGSETEDMNRMSFQVSGKTKKSFKTTPPPPNATKPPPAPGPTPAQSSNGSTKSNGAPPSPAISHTSTGSGEIPRGPGQRSLEITLPSGNTVTATVDDKLQMMDLVVMIAAKNKLNPTGHVIIPSSASRTDISQFKASQRIGELDTTKLQIVPKLSRGEIQSLKGSEKRKATQFEQTIRLTVLSGKNHKALLRVNPEKPIQEFLPQVYEELAVVGANDPRLRLVKKPDEDIDYSKSLNYYEVNELLLVDLNPPPPPQEPEPAPIEKKKKSMFGRKSKKKGEVTLEPTAEVATKPAAAAPQKDMVVESAQAVTAHAPAVKQASVESNDSVPGENTLKKRRPAPPPPSAAKKETSSQGGQSPKTTLERASHAVSKKRRAPAPPPAGGAPLPPAVPLPLAAAPDVTVNGNGDASPAMSDQERRITFGNAEVMESGSESASSVTPSPAETPSSTLERRKDGGDATEIQPQEVDVNFAELDAGIQITLCRGAIFVYSDLVLIHVVMSHPSECYLGCRANEFGHCACACLYSSSVLDDSNLPSDPSSVAPDPPKHDATDGGPAQGAVPVPLTPPPVFVPPPPPNEPPSPGEPQEDVGKLIEEGILLLARGGGEGPDTISECSSALTEDLGGEEAISVSEVSVGGNDQSQVPAAEDPESGEKIKVDATLTVGESAEEEVGEEEKEVGDDQEVVEAEDTVVVQSERPTEEDVEETSDILDKRAALTRMMKLSLDDDSNETTSYSPTPQGEESDSVLEEKSLTALAAPVSRQSLDDAASESKAEDVVQDTAEETEEKVEELAEDGAEQTREQVAEEVDDKDVEMSKDSKDEEQVVTEKEQQVEEKPDDAERKVGDGEKEEGQKQEKEDVSVDKEQETASETVKVEPGQPSMQQLTEQYKQLQQQMAMLQQQLMANPSAAHMAANPGMSYQMQQMQQQQMQQQIMLQQQLLLQQQQQQQVLMPSQAPYMMMQQPGGGVLMSPPQMVYTPMGMQPMPVYGQMTPPQAISTPVEQAPAPPAVAPEKSAEDSGKLGGDEADAPLKEDSPKVDQMVEAIPEDTPTKPQVSAQASASGRRNVFADILKKKNNPKASYVLSAQREAQRQRSDSNSSLNSSSSSSKDDSVSGSMSMSLSTSKTDSRTETTAPPPEARRQESIELVTNGLSPTLPTPPETPEASPIRDDATPTAPPKPDSPVSPSSPNNSSHDESNNNTSKSVTVDADVQPKVPVQNPKHDPVLPLPTDNNAKKAPPPIRPKPQVGPRPYRPASMYARIGEGASDSQVETSKFSAHARKVADLRSMFMLGK